MEEVEECIQRYIEEGYRYIRCHMGTYGGNFGGKRQSIVKPDFLVKQVSSSVKWQQCVETMLADGVDTFIEIGPGKTLAGFMKKIDRSVKTLNVEKLEDIEKVVEALKEA